MKDKVKAYTEDIAKYVARVDKKLVEALARRMAGVMGRADARLVAASDKEELKRVRVNFVKGKLGITSVEKADKAIATVKEMMKKDRSKSRITFYYLLAVELKAKAKYLA